MYPKRHTNGFFFFKKLFILVSVSVSDILQGTKWFVVESGWNQTNQTSPTLAPCQCKSEGCFEMKGVMYARCEQGVRGDQRLWSQLSGLGGCLWLRQCQRDSGPNQQSTATVIHKRTGSQAQPRSYRGMRCKGLRWWDYWVGVQELKLRVWGVL